MGGAALLAALLLVQAPQLPAAEGPPEFVRTRAAAQGAIDVVYPLLEAGPLRIYDSRKGTWVELESREWRVAICPASLFPDGTYKIQVEMADKGSDAVRYDVDFYVKDGKVVDTILRRKNGLDRLRGSEPTVVGEGIAGQVHEIVRRYLEQTAALRGGEFLLRDSRDPERINSLWLDSLEEKVYRTEDGAYYLHADFLDRNGVVYDLDFYAVRERTDYRLVDLVIHKVAGTDRLR